MVPTDPLERRRCSDRCDGELLDVFAEGAAPALARPRAGLALDRFDVAFGEDLFAVGLARLGGLFVVCLAALGRDAAAAPELRGARVAARDGLPLEEARDELPLDDPLGLARLRRERVDAERELLELLEVVERSAIILS